MAQPQGAATGPKQTEADQDSGSRPDARSLDYPRAIEQVPTAPRKNENCMTKLLTWRDEWSLGIDTLDTDHRDLVGNLVDICLRFCPLAANPAGLPAGLAAPGASVFGGSDQGDLIESLAAFGAKFHAHCRREESFMRAIHYPRVAEHAAEHLALMTDFSEILRDWRSRGLQVFDDTAQEWVRHWLVAHVLGSDRDFAAAYFELCGLAGPDVAGADHPKSGHLSTKNAKQENNRPARRRSPPR
jgi:hemerythrin